MAEGRPLTDGAKPFGVVATFVIGTIALLVGQLSGIAALSGWYGLSLKEVSALSQHGGAIVLFIFVSAPVQVALLALAASHKGSVAEYLGYKLPRRGELVAAVLVLAALIIVGDIVSWLAGRHIVDRFQSDIYQAAKSANLLPLLLIAITILIPIGEETRHANRAGPLRRTARRHTGPRRSLVGLLPRREREGWREARLLRGLILSVNLTGTAARA